MKDWEQAALDTLTKSLEPLPHEKNELDWKATLSENKDRLKEHLSAFANLDGGGVLVFGVNNNGSLKGIVDEPYENIIQKLGNMAREGLEPAISLDHSILTYKDTALLFIYIPESKERPVHIRSKTIYDSFIRVSGQTRKMTRQEVARLIAHSSPSSFEQELALEDLEENKSRKFAAYIPFWA